MSYDPTNAGGGFNPFNQGGSHESVFQKEQSFISKVFNWMFLGLATTGVVAFLVSTNPVILRAIYSNQLIFWGLAIGTFLLVWNISSNIYKMSPAAASANFFIYAGLNGVLLSSVFVIYTSASIFSTFLIAASIFGVMALYGATTKKDLSGWGSILFMGLIGLIIAQIVNMFFHISGLASILNYAGVLIFTGLTAYDMQKIKQIGQSADYHPNLAIRGALSLYLDFINLFLYLLRILGRRK